MEPLIVSTNFLQTHSTRFEVDPANELNSQNGHLDDRVAQRMNAIVQRFIQDEHLEHHVQGSIYGESIELPDHTHQLTLQYENRRHSYLVDQQGQILKEVPTSYLTLVVPKTMDEVRDSFYDGGIKALSTLIALNKFAHYPTEIFAKMLVARARQIEAIVNLGTTGTGRGAVNILCEAYGARRAADLPATVQEALRSFSPTDMRDVYQGWISTGCLDNPTITPAVYARLEEHFVEKMRLTDQEWQQLDGAFLRSEFLRTEIEKQIAFLGIRLDEIRDVLDSCLVLGVLKGRNPEDMGMMHRFLKQHSEKAFGSQSTDYDFSLSTQEKQRIESMRRKELHFAQLCYEYDQYISGFANKFRERALETLKCVAEFRREVNGEPDCTVSSIIMDDLAEREPFQGDFYQGSIPIEDIEAALRDPSTNFRVTMWICANLDDFFEQFFIGDDGHGRSNIDRFEEFIRKKHPEIQWFNFGAMRAQMEVASYVEAHIPKVRPELRKARGRSLFHPRAPLTQIAREASHFERVHRKKVSQTPEQQRTQQEEEVRCVNDYAQQHAIPLSMAEIKRQNPELYRELSEKFDLSTPEGIRQAEGYVVAFKGLVQTQWRSGGHVWAMNETELKDKDSGKVYHSTDLTKMLCRAVPMVGGISGHVEFILHLATYLGIDRTDAFISAFAHLVLCNAHSVAETFLGAAGFMNTIPGDLYDQFEFNETMVPTLAQWVLRNVPENHPFYPRLKAHANDVNE